MAINFSEEVGCLIESLWVAGFSENLIKGEKYLR